MSNRFLLLFGIAFVAINAQAIDLGTAASFAVLGSSEVTNTGPSVINGDLGVFPGTSITGFPPGVINGVIQNSNAVAQIAQNDATNAYSVAAGLPFLTANDLTGEDLGGRILTPAVYHYDSSAGLTGTLVLDGSGDPDSVFVFQIGSTLITGTSSTVVLINGAQACNVFWQVGSSATLETGTIFRGNILALASISVNSGATNSGGLYALTGAVTLINNVIDTQPLCINPVPNQTTSTTMNASSSTGTITVTSGSTFSSTTTPPAPITTPSPASPLSTNPSTTAATTSPSVISSPVPSSTIITSLSSSSTSITTIISIPTSTITAFSSSSLSTSMTTTPSAIISSTTAFSPGISTITTSSTSSASSAFSSSSSILITTIPSITISTILDSSSSSSILITTTPLITTSDFLGSSSFSSSTLTTATPSITTSDFLGSSSSASSTLTTAIPSITTSTVLGSSSVSSSTLTTAIPSITTSTVLGSSSSASSTLVTTFHSTTSYLATASSSGTSLTATPSTTPSSSTTTLVQTISSTSASFTIIASTTSSSTATTSTSIYLTTVSSIISSSTTTSSISISSVASTSTITSDTIISTTIFGSSTSSFSIWSSIWSSYSTPQIRSSYTTTESYTPSYTTFSEIGYSTSKFYTAQPWGEWEWTHGTPLTSLHSTILYSAKVPLLPSEVPMLEKHTKYTPIPSMTTIVIACPTNKSSKTNWEDMAIHSYPETSANPTASFESSMTSDEPKMATTILPFSNLPNPTLSDATIVPELFTTSPTSGGITRPSGLSLVGSEDATMAIKSSTSVVSDLDPSTSLLTSQFTGSAAILSPRLVLPISIVLGIGLI